MDTLDATLPMTIRMFTMCVVSVVATLFVIIYATPVFVVVLPPLAVIYVTALVRRAGSTRWPPRLSHIARTHTTGVTVCPTVYTLGQDMDLVDGQLGSILMMCVTFAIQGVIYMCVVCYPVPALALVVPPLALVYGGVLVGLL